jgi:hypothetical protein
MGASLTLPYIYQHSRSTPKKTKAQMVLYLMPPLGAFSFTLSTGPQSERTDPTPGRQVEGKCSSILMSPIFLR